MKRTNTVRVFRFDAKTDYLPYYKPYLVKTQESSTPREILDEISVQDPMFFQTYANEKFCLIGDFIYELDEPIRQAGDLTISPVSTNNVTKDFLLNTDDFWQKFKLLESFCDETDKTFYAANVHYFYASSVRKFLPQFIGEAALLLADRLIRKYPKSELEILKKISRKEDGIWHYAFLQTALASKNVAVDETVLALKEKIFAYGLCPDLQAHKKKLLDIYKDQNFFESNLNLKSFNLSKFEGLNIAIYLGNYARSFRHIDLESIAAEQGFKTVKHSHTYAYSGLESFAISPELFSKAAGEILADAYDSGAELLITPWKNFAKTAREQAAAIQRQLGRRIDISVIDVAQIV